MKRLGLIGFGSFGQFMTPFLKPYFEIHVYDQLDLKQDAQKAGVKWESLQEVAACELVVFAVPVQYLEGVLKEAAPYIMETAMVFDVSSVKVKPVELMKKYLPEETEIVGTHPLFGPQSAKHGIEGLNLVICPVRTAKTAFIFRFFSKLLKLNVMERTPKLHDKQMAYVQALTHFIGRAVNEMDIPDVEQKTPAYQYLLDIKRNLGQDSMELFLTIENENPYAKEIRSSFLEELEILHKKLRS